MGQDVFVYRDLIIMMDKLMVLLIKGYKNQGKTFGIDLDVGKYFHHFSARLHKLGQGDG